MVTHHLTTLFAETLKQFIQLIIVVQRLKEPLMSRTLNGVGDLIGTVAKCLQVLFRPAAKLLVLTPSASKPSNLLNKPFLKIQLNFILSGVKRCGPLFRVEPPFLTYLLISIKYVHSKSGGIAFSCIFMQFCLTCCTITSLRPSGNYRKSSKRHQVCATKSGYFSPNEWVFALCDWEFSIFRVLVSYRMLRGREKRGRSLQLVWHQLRDGAP